jgi:transketolase
LGERITDRWIARHGLAAVVDAMMDAIVEAAARTGFVITVEEHTVIGGLGGAVAETLSAAYPVRVERLGIQDIYGESGPDDALLDKYGLSAERVAGAVAGLVAVKRGAQ